MFLVDSVMTHILNSKDVILSDNVFLEFIYQNDEPVLDVNRAVRIARSNPAFAAKLLFAVPEGVVPYWHGPSGVVVRTRGGKKEISGNNSFGEFLGSVREAVAVSLRESPLDEIPVREGQVITDFTRKGAFRSDIEQREQNGVSFIHTDMYRPARFRRDVSLDGTTGHAGRNSDEDVSFHNFVCPFGTSYPSPVIVGSAAEAAILYEQALRGELDWEALFDNLRDRNLVDKSLTERQLKGRIQDYKAQFDWMREQVSSNPELRRMQIVASSAMVADASMGRSIYDASLAPSPAFVLARYINNPTLLFDKSVNGVMRSLSEAQKDEPERFVAKEGGSVIVIGGSDTIGGREPGAKATHSLERYEKEADGKKVIASRKRIDFPMKSDEEINRDYAAFSRRMDEILSGMGDSPVTLVTGNVSTLGDTVGAGTPQMVTRYVREKGGAVLEYDFNRHAPVARGSEKVHNPNLRVIRYPHFAECLPVILGRDDSVSFLLDSLDDKSEVRYFNARPSAEGEAVDPDRAIVADGFVCFSSDEDSNVRNVLSVASFAVDSGLPVIHVMNNQSEEEQRVSLSEGALISRSGIRGGISLSSDNGELFRGDLKSEWDFGEANHLSMVDADSGAHIPNVVVNYPSPVLVDGYPFHSAVGTYLALRAKELGYDANKDLFRSISDMESSGRLDSLPLLVAGEIDKETQERILRQAVRMMSEANGDFRSALMDLDGRPVVFSSSVDIDGLFVDADGRGENRFGLVFASESQALRDSVKARIAMDEKEREQALAEAEKRQKIATAQKAEGQKIKGGLPESIEAAADAVWFLGTNAPVGLTIPDEEHSFEMWNEENGMDPLNREKASRQYIENPDGVRIDNSFVYLFPSDLYSVTGRSIVRNRPDSRNLTGVTRIDEKTGQQYQAAFGIPVRINNLGNELANADGYPCSYRLDNDSSKFAASIVLADSRARVTALRHGLALSLPGCERMDGTSYYTLGQVFMDKIWNKKEHKMVDNPHKAPLNFALTETYINMLTRGKHYPLNCIVLPRPLYRTQTDAEVQAKVDAGERFISAEGRFLSDLMMSLNIANATALALGVPLRFPLDKDGRIDLGPGVPEEYRLLAERRIDSFIGVRKAESINEGALPYLERIPMSETSKYRASMVKAGTDVDRMPANDLVYAFGEFDFSSILSGQPAPLHQMAFRDADGDVFVLNDSQTTRSVSTDEINAYLSYSKNDLRRFTVRTTNPDKVPALSETLKAYVDRAKAIKIEMRLLSEGEKGSVGLGLDGFVNLLSSNSEEFAMSEHDIGREATIFNAMGTVSREKVKDGNGKVIGTKEVQSERDIDGNKIEQGYWGRVDAGDGFRGWAQIHYTLPDGTKSGWKTVDDLELAKDIVMTLVKRKYRTDERVVPSLSVMEMLCKSWAVEEAGEAFRAIEWKSNRKVEVDDKIVDLSESPVTVVPVEAPAEVKEDEVPEVKPQAEQGVSEIAFTVSSGGYSQRTRENANADDVDFTIAVSVDLNTAGERCTRRAAGDSFIGIEVRDFSEESLKVAVDHIYENLPEEFQKGEPMGVNFAGNGLYTLNAHGISQEEANVFASGILAGLKEKGVVIQSGRSGGQTGMDEAFILGLSEMGVPVTCHAPKDFLFRGADGKDVKGDEKAFKARFNVQVRRSLKKSNGVSF